MKSNVDIRDWIETLKSKQTKDPVGFENEIKSPAENLNELFYCYILNGNKAFELIDLNCVKDEENGNYCWAYFAEFRLSSSTGKYEFQRLIKCDKYSDNSTRWDNDGFFETMRYKKRVQSLNGRGDYYRFLSAYTMLLKDDKLTPKYNDFEVTEFVE